jgi:hypothetical protein
MGASLPCVFKNGAGFHFMIGLPNASGMSNVSGPGMGAFTYGESAHMPPNTYQRIRIRPNYPNRIFPVAKIHRISII